MVGIIMVINFWLVSSNVLALTNEERIQMLDDKFIAGEISEETYKRLLEKYGGATASSKPKTEAKPVQEVQGNLVKNFSFEHLASDGSPQGWVIERTGRYGSSASVGLSTLEAHSGKSSMSFSNSMQYGTDMVLQEIPLEPGKKYKVVFWAKGEGLQRNPKSDGMPCVVNLDYKSQDGKLKPIYIEPKIAGEWKQVVKVLAIPGDAVEGGRICLRLYMASGTLWIDDVAVVSLP